MRSRKGCKSRSALVTAPTVVSVPVLLSFLQMIMIVKGHDQSGALRAACRQRFVALQAGRSASTTPDPLPRPHFHPPASQRRWLVKGDRTPLRLRGDAGESAVAGLPAPMVALALTGKLPVPGKLRASWSAGTEWGGSTRRGTRCPGAFARRPSSARNLRFPISAKADAASEGGCLRGHRRPARKLPLASERGRVHDNHHLVTTRLRVVRGGGAHDGTPSIVRRWPRSQLAASRQLHGRRSRALLSRTGRIDAGSQGGLPRVCRPRGLPGVRDCQQREVRHLGRDERAGATPSEARPGSRPGCEHGIVTLD